MQSADRACSGWESPGKCRVRQSSRLSLILLVCLAATGVQWDMLQVFAWGRMIVDHAATMPLSAAVAKTFDGEMCSLCCVVARAQRRESAPAHPADAKVAAKPILFFQLASVVVPDAARSLPWHQDMTMASGRDRAAPAAPPPRSAAA